MRLAFVLLCALEALAFADAAPPRVYREGARWAARCEARMERARAAAAALDSAVIRGKIEVVDVKDCNTGGHDCAPKVSFSFRSGQQLLYAEAFWSLEDYIFLKWRVEIDCDKSLFFGLHESICGIEKIENGIYAYLLAAAQSPRSRLFRQIFQPAIDDCVAMNRPVTSGSR